MKHLDLFIFHLQMSAYVRSHGGEDENVWIALWEQEKK